MKKLLLVWFALWAMVLVSQAQDELVLGIYRGNGGHRPRILRVSDYVELKIAQQPQWQKGRIEEISDSTVKLKGGSVLKLNEITGLRKPSGFKNTLGVVFGGALVVVGGGVAMIATGATGGLAGLVAGGIVCTAVGTPIAGTTGFPYLLIKTRYRIGKQYQLKSFHLSDLPRRAPKTTEI